MTLYTSAGHNPQLQRSLKDHFKGILMSRLRVGFGDSWEELINELLAKYGAMVRGEDHKGEIFPYFPTEFRVVNGMPVSTIINDWQRGDTLKVEWIKSLVEPLDKPKSKEGK